MKNVAEGMEGHPRVREPVPVTTHYRERTCNLHFHNDHIIISFRSQKAFPNNKPLWIIIELSIHYYERHYFDSISKEYCNESKVLDVLPCDTRVFTSKFLCSLEMFCHSSTSPQPTLVLAHTVLSSAKHDQMVSLSEIYAIQSRCGLPIGLE